MCQARKAIRRFMAVAPVGLLVIFLLGPVQNADAQGKGKPNSSQRSQQGSRLPGNSVNRQRNGAGSNSFDAILSQSQLEQLLGMHEEEKLAHDVYVALAKSSGLQIFSNISYAESQHMRAIEQLVSRYASNVPLANLAPGTFSNPQIQQLYTELVAAGTASPTAALAVGAKIEEMDIRDLQRLLSQNLPQQVARVLENLQRASGNHLRAFMGALQKSGATYSPEFLDQRVFDSIVQAGSAQGSAQSVNRRMGMQGQSGNGKMGMQRQGGKGKMNGRRR
jgi:hypothetical protein